MDSLEDGGCTIFEIGLFHHGRKISTSPGSFIRMFCRTFPVWTIGKTLQCEEMSSSIQKMSTLSPSTIVETTTATIHLGSPLITYDNTAASRQQQQRPDSLEYPFEEYNVGKEQYRGHLALLHKEHMEYYSLGLMCNQNFMPETVDDVYINNLYALSWFSDGCYPFDSYEDEKDTYLYTQAILKHLEEEVDVALAQYSDIL
jgi:hypothetical protein